MYTKDKRANEFCFFEFLTTFSTESLSSGTIAIIIGMEGREKDVLPSILTHP